jgi:hypothetical protein
VIVINIRYVESHMQFADRSAPWKILKAAENPVLQASNPPAGISGYIGNKGSGRVVLRSGRLACRSE